MLKTRIPFTLILGLLVIAVSEALLFTDVALTHREAIPPFAWSGYLLALDGILTIQRTGSPVRRRPHHFAVLCFASVFIWCVFDFLNFHNGIYAWVYIGMPVGFSEKYVPYLLAFGSVVPGMLMSGQVMLNWGWFDWAQTAYQDPQGQSPRRRRGLYSAISFTVGAAMLAWPILHPTPITNLTLWTSFVFLLDPINDGLGRPSMFRDWRHGWYGRTLATFAGGLLCGFLWEFWNYWALSKWTYDLPFLGSWGKHHYFEMPLPGLLGFLPFGLECWVMWQTIRIPLDGLVEPLPDARTLL
jgi:hypothetical protein